MLPHYFDVEDLNYGQLVKLRDENGRLVGKERWVIFGKLDVDDIETSDVENFNGVLRERLGRLVRKTKCIFKKKHCLHCAISFFMFYWNFISQIRRGKTSAMIEGVICANLDVARILLHRIKPFKLGQYQQVRRCQPWAVTFALLDIKRRVIFLFSAMNIPCFQARFSGREVFSWILPLLAMLCDR